MTLDRIISALVTSRNGAADEALLEAVRLGAPPEQAVALAALFRRKTSRGLVGVVGAFAALSEPLQAFVIEQVDGLQGALRDAGRSEETAVRCSAMTLIARARQGRLSHVLAENVRHPDEAIANPAAAALLTLTQWLVAEARGLQRPDEADGGNDPWELERARAAAYQRLTDNRPDVEAAVARGMDSPRGKPAADLVAAAVLLADAEGSKTLAMLHAARHAGQTAMVRFLQQQPPAADHVDALLLGSGLSILRAGFANAVAKIEASATLDQLLRRTYWLRDNDVAVSVRTVTRGTWAGEGELLRDAARRDGADVARVAEWIAASGLPDATQDERLTALRDHLLAVDPNNVDARLRLLRSVCTRRRGTSVALLRAYLDDPDERLVRLAVRELVRRRPAEVDGLLMQRLSTLPPDARRVAARAVGQSGFEQLWTNYPKLDKVKRKAIGRALIKLLPDAPLRLGRKLAANATQDDKLRALSMAHDLRLAEGVRGPVMALCTDPSPRVRSKAVLLLAEMPDVAPDPLIERLLTDADPRVRANAIDVLESRHGASAFVPVLIQRARAGNNRERANAIRVMHRLSMDAFGGALQTMLIDARPDHRVSALWAVRETQWWQLAPLVARMAQTDGDERVRKHAVGVLKAAAELIRERQRAAG